MNAVIKHNQENVGICLTVCIDRLDGYVTESQYTEFISSKHEHSGSESMRYVVFLLGPISLNKVGPCWPFLVLLPPL